MTPAKTFDSRTFDAGLFDSLAEVSVNRELPPDRVTVRIADPRTGQTIARWAEDEPLVENVVANLAKSGEMPGGHKEMTGSLSRDPRRDWPDLAPYSDVYVEQAGGENIWEGRIDKAPESDGERMVIEPAAVGHQAALEDRKGIIGPGFLNQDYGAWGEVSAARKIAGRSGGLSPERNLSAEPDLNGSPRLSMLISGKYDDTEAEALFGKHGIDVARLIVDQVERVGLANDANLTAKPRAWADDAAGSEQEGSDSKAASSIDFTPTTPAPFVVLNWRWSGAGPVGSEGGDYGFRYGGIKVLGDHGLALQGEGSGQGFTAKQMLGYAIPLYTYLEVSDESLEDDEFIIPHAWFSDPGDMAAVVKELTKYGLLDWFVLNGKLFEHRFPGTYGRRWQAYGGPSNLKEAGIDGSRLWRTILVSYQDVDGSTRTVGPPGSGANVETAQLEITDPDHPAVKADIAREDVLALSGVGTAASAQAAGERWLEDANQLSRSGSAELTGYVMDDKGTLRPVGQVQPGDYIRFPDAGSTDYRKLVAVSYDHDSRNCSVTLDAPPEAVQALLERYQAALIPLGLS